MRHFLVAGVLAMSLHAPAHKPVEARCTARAFRPFAAQVWAPELWQRGNPPKRVVAAYKRRLRCAGPGNRRAMEKTWRRDKAAYFAYRHEIRSRLRYLPENCGGYRSAIPCYIVACESGGNYGAENPSSTAGGKYQILDTTWYDYGGVHYPYSHPAAHAPPAEQDRIAYAIFQDSGPSAWSCG